MYCVNCGKEIANDVRYCAYCGADQMQKVVSNVSEENSQSSTAEVILNDSNREQVLSTLETAKDIIYEAYSYLNKIDEAQNEAMKQMRFMVDKNLNSASKVWYLLGGGFCAIFGIGGLFYSLIASPSGLFISLIFLAIGAYAIYEAVFPSKIGKELNQKIQHYKEQALEVFRSNADKLAFLDGEYWNPEGIDYLIKVLETGRARTWREALALGETHMHQYRMESKQEEMMTKVEQIAADAHRAAAAAERAESSASDAAAFAAFSAFFRR